MKTPGYLARALILLSIEVAHLAGAQTTDGVLRLDITPPNVPIREADFTLQVIMTNRTTQPMTIVKTSPGCDFSADVRDAEGQMVPSTPAGAELSKCSGRVATGRWIRILLQPGESTEESYPISLYYALSRPGVYSVRLFRELSSQPGRVTRSNEVQLKLAQ